MSEELTNFVSWDEFWQNWKWFQGEHVTLVGHTGSGKTTIAMELLKKRTYTVVFAAKPKDELLDNLPDDYKTIKEWPDGRKPWSRKLPNRVILHPDVKALNSRGTQAREFHAALQAIYKEGGRCVYFDEIRYLSNNLGLQEDLETLWLQGRSLKISVVGGTQRPSWIPLEAYSQATHLFLFRENDETNLKRLGGIGGVSKREVIQIVSTLPKHHCLVVNTRDGSLITTKAERSLGNT